MTQRGRGRPPHPGILTPAERRVLEELRRGGTNAEIAVRLGVTLDAVKFHISNMLGKLGLDNRHELAAWRPEPRRRLFGLLAVPGTLEPIGRLLVWTGVAAAGTAAVAVVAVVLIVLSTLDGSEQQLAQAPTATATPTATPTAGGSAALDRAALVALYNATDGANWQTSTNWLTDRPIGEWHRVTVDGDGRVTQLDLSDNQLSGPIPAELGGLTNLRQLRLVGNQLSGPILAELGGLTNLEGLWLSGNQLSGPMPAELGDLTNLRDLRLVGNQLSGCLDRRLGEIPRNDLAALGLPFCD